MELLSAHLGALASLRLGAIGLQRCGWPGPPTLSGAAAAIERALAPPTIPGGAYIRAVGLGP